MAHAVDHPKKRHSLAGIGSLGLLIGLLVGLSASPVVGSLLGTLATLAVALVGGGVRLPWTQKDAEKADKSPSAGPFDARWLVVFCLCTILAILAGIWIRTHNILSPSLRQQVIAYQQAGFTLQEAKQTLSNQMVASAKTGKTPGDSLLFGNRQEFDLDEFNPERIPDAVEIIHTWRSAVAPPLMQSLAQEIDAIEFSSATQKLNVMQAIWNALETAQKNTMEKEANQ